MKTKLLPLFGALLCATSLTSCYVYDDPLSWSSCGPSYYNSGYYNRGYGSYCPPTRVVSRSCPPPVMYRSTPSHHGHSGFRGGSSFGHFRPSSSPPVFSSPSGGGFHGGSGHSGSGGFGGGHGGHSGGHSHGGGRPSGGFGVHQMTAPTVVPSSPAPVLISAPASMPVSMPVSAPAFSEPASMPPASPPPAPPAAAEESAPPTAPAPSEPTV